MERIMVCYNGTPSAKEALYTAITHAKAFGAKVDIVYSFSGNKEKEKDKFNQAEKDLGFAKDFLMKSGVSCDVHLLCRGMSPGEDITNFANENKIEEIIIGVKHRSKMGKIIHSSTAQYVILEANCPVLSVK